MNHKRNIQSYYDQTLVHYRQHWKLKEIHAIHYGLWYPGTRKLSEALTNTNQKIADYLRPGGQEWYLDAGCGVGGTARFLARKFGCRVNGITVGGKQIEFANSLPESERMANLVKLEERDYHNTGYADQQFDGLYAMESMCHSPKKEEFLAEAYRLLKPGGTLVVIDYFQKPQELSSREDAQLHRWLSKWAIPNIVREDHFGHLLLDAGFGSEKTRGLNSGSATLLEEDVLQRPGR